MMTAPVVIRHVWFVHTAVVAAQSTPHALVPGDGHPAFNVSVSVWYCSWSFLLIAADGHPHPQTLPSRTLTQSDCVEHD